MQRGQVDLIDFVLAGDLGMSLQEVRALPSSEVEEWRAFLAVKRQREELDTKKSKMRG